MPRRSPQRSHSRLILDAGLFHQAFYQHQRSDRFGSLREAFKDYLDYGVSAALSPHPLFDVGFYLRRNPDVQASGTDPVLHYLSEGWREGRDPHPLFDHEWYTRQHDVDEHVAPLPHYLTHARSNHASPNPLFDTRFYVDENDDITQAGINPLEHYLLYGRDEGRLPSARLRTVLSAWCDVALSLRRGTWKREHTLWVWFRRDGSRAEDNKLLRVVQDAYQRTRLDVRVVVDGPGPALIPVDGVRIVHLDDVGLSTSDAPACRPSALRMLLFALSSGVHHVDLWQTVDDPRMAEACADLGLSVDALTCTLDVAPATGAFVPHVASMLERSSLTLARSRSSTPHRKRIYVPCTDWSISGVHTVAEALGRVLIARGWDFRLLFTRGTIGVLDRTTEGHGLPVVPYEFIDSSACHSEREHWAAIIRHLEWQAPCVVLATFDDFANAVVPALSDQVGVVGWLQSDEDHYYESAYRLGRYWNAIAGVSQRIVEEVVRLNPSFGDRTHLIHNTTVGNGDILRQRIPDAGPDLRLVYVGRLIQYQKRILDVIPLVQRLEDLGVNYHLTLIGACPDHDIESQLRKTLAGALAAGRVRLTGPLNRERIFEQLREHNVFLLLSDFEGLPVSLIEAMACGCIPAVAYSDSGIPDVLGTDDSGLVFDSRDYGVWATALDALVRDPARVAAMSERARRTVIDRFTADVMADRFEDLLSTVLRQIDSGTWRRPPALSWRNPIGDVLAPPSMVGKLLG